MPDILEYSGEGYKAVMSFGNWKVAFINYAERFDERSFTRVERHNETDEVFVLLSGEAILVCGEELKRIPMEQGKVYNVKCGEWHHIFVKRGAKVLVAENADTGAENTEYRLLDGGVLTK